MQSFMYSVLIYLNIIAEIIVPIMPIYFLNISFIVLALIIFNISIYNWNLLTVLPLLLLSIIIIFSLIVSNIFWFYYAFELLLLPIYLIVYYFGYTEDRKFSGLFFIYFALISSLMWLVSIIYIYSSGYYSNLTVTMIALLFLLPILVKVPIMPLHLWLNEIHTGSPVSGSILLAGIILKISIYAIIVYLIPLFSQHIQFILQVLIVLVIPSILLSAYTTIRQVDYKRLIAYSSINHMNFILFTCLTCNNMGIAAGIIFCFGHGIISALLFIQANSLNLRFNTRNISLFQGLMYTMPIFTFFALFAHLANIGFPPFINWWAELIIICSNFYSFTFASILIALSIVISIYYSIWCFYRIYFGELNFTFNSDICALEFYLNLYIFFLGLFATFFILI